MKKRFVSFDKVKIVYERINRDSKKPTLIFLHGLGGNSTVWKHTLEEAEKKDYSILWIDLRGHGYSDYPNEEEKYKLEYYARD